jgi:putative hydrolase of the HAD superfamily
MQHLLIDLDDTLVDDRAATASAFAAFLDSHAAIVGRQDRGDLLERWRALSIHHWDRFARGEVTFLGQRRERVRDFLQADFSDAEADRAFEPYWSTYESSYSLFADVPAFLDRTRQLRKVIVTNGERPQQLRKLETTGLLAHVEKVVTPTDCGHWKPQAGIFGAALRALDVEPGSCMMIGDSLANDIEPAKALGMASFHVDRANGRDLSGLF